VMRPCQARAFVRSDSHLNQLDRVAVQPHLTLSLEHEQQDGNLLTRHLGAEPGMADKRAGNNLYAVADLGALGPRSVGRSIAPLCSRFAGRRSPHPARAPARRLQPWPGESRPDTGAHCATAVRYG
jgi:hypothetical protein